MDNGKNKAGGGEEFLDNSILEMFGLTYEQARLMFSAQLMLARYDCAVAKNRANAEIKDKWIQEWEKSIESYLKGTGGNCSGKLYPGDGLAGRFMAEISASNNRTWYYIVVLELLEFTAYTPLGGGDDKHYGKCKYDVKKTKAFLKEFIIGQGYLSEEKAARLDRTYNKSLAQISGQAPKIAAKMLAVIAVSGIAAALTAAAAGPIAVALVGSAFPGLHGAALTAACLALIGGGSIAVGGAGMAGGVAIIAGGGALLGLAGGGTAVGVGSKILSSAPEFTLTQAAKLETILKEVILNEQQDVAAAQKIIESYRNQISELNRQLGEMKLQNEKNAKDLEKIMTYLEKSFKNMATFTSAYETGTQMGD